MRRAGEPTLRNRFKDTPRGSDCEKNGCVNDPSAGSPTETLLRLLLPLSDEVYLTSRTRLKDARSPKGSPDHSKSVGATGGVYKGQGRNQHKLMTYAY